MTIFVRRNDQCCKSHYLFFDKPRPSTPFGKAQNKIVLAQKRPESMDSGLIL